MPTEKNANPRKGKRSKKPLQPVSDQRLTGMVNKLQKVVLGAPQEASALNVQIGGGHYKGLGRFQPWEVMKAWLTPEEFKGYMKGTVCAYLCRESDKGGREDIEKAMHTMQLYLELSK